MTTKLARMWGRVWLRWSWASSVTLAISRMSRVREVPLAVTQLSPGYLTCTLAVLFVLFLMSGATVLFVVRCLLLTIE